jgi:hypothetical protein
VEPEAVASRLRVMTARAFVAALAGFPLAFAISMTVALLVLRLYGLSATEFWRATIAVLSSGDVLYAFAKCAVNAAFVLTGSWVTLIPLTRTSWSLRSKMLIALLAVGATNLLLSAFAAVVSD